MVGLAEFAVISLKEGSIIILTSKLRTFGATWQRNKDHLDTEDKIRQMAATFFKDPISEISCQHF